jgi:ribulose-5-phosphate 4-epimerase/fuculose-1-phosphate aldolase
MTREEMKAEMAALIDKAYLKGWTDGFGIGMYEKPEEE